MAEAEGGEHFAGPLRDLRARMGDLVHRRRRLLHRRELLLHRGRLLLRRGAGLGRRRVQVRRRRTVHLRKIRQPRDHRVKRTPEATDLVVAAVHERPEQVGPTCSTKLITRPSGRTITRLMAIPMPMQTVRGLVRGDVPDHPRTARDGSAEPAVRLTSGGGNIPDPCDELGRRIKNATVVGLRAPLTYCARFNFMPAIGNAQPSPERTL